MDRPIVLKDSEKESPVPEVWRRTFRKIVEAFREGDFSLKREIQSVQTIPEAESSFIAKYVADYGCSLVSLPEETWETSVCLWMDDYWDVLVDLYTIEEGASDLVLAARVFEDGASFTFEIKSLYVP